jgi:hypothetical protein
MVRVAICRTVRWWLTGAMRRKGIAKSNRPSAVLTLGLSSHRLINVYRLVALLLVPALMATSATTSLVHTHAYSDHDHPEHHHGLSAHEHHGTAPHGRDGVARLEGCEPGQHTVSLTFVSAAPQIHTLDVELTVAPSGTSNLEPAEIVHDNDVRVHGPPGPPESSPRGPPFSFTA